MPRLVLLAVPAVRSAISRELGRDIEYHELIDSTQTRARGLATAGAVSGVVVANEQRAGLGTRGRSWHALAGSSLLASWISHPAPRSPALVAALTGVAIARALEVLGCSDALLKWPNDVVLAGRKLAGVIAHATSDGGGGTLVLGIGINVHQRRGDLHTDLADTATSLAIAGHEIDRLALLAVLTVELDRLRDPAEIAGAHREWTERSSLLGHGVEVRVDGRTPFAGTATAIDDEGALLVHTAGGIERVISGDVRLA
ncbi:MAG TPA: biotin--[acetyl-CoA-carboxylase] ligase [Candidatus Limnocylindria bacterium]|jgi:BirA family biotin operon repressor/biotin-[acetyl-CoA-carboxylase] ligase